MPTLDSYPPDYPEEYITGKVRFFGRDFFVTPEVLIPRLETEGLIRHARNILKNKDKNTKTIVIDIGCGSGIIGTSVADLADEVIFLDISPAALSITEQNFHSHFPEKEAQFIVSDLLNNLPAFSTLGENIRYLFLTNLPYIKGEDWDNMSADTVYEPVLALFGGDGTGFELYERLFQEFASLKLSNCKSVKVIYEFGFDQRDIAESRARNYPKWEYSFFADYAGIERFGEIGLKKSPE